MAARNQVAHRVNIGWEGSRTPDVIILNNCIRDGAFKNTFFTLFISSSTYKKLFSYLYGNFIQSMR